MRIGFEQVLKRHVRAHSPETKAAWLEAYERLGTAAAASDATGVPEATGRSWLYRYNKRLRRQAEQEPAA